jgi:hypothetical protein
MARQQQKLTALQVSKLAKPGLYGDGGGLTLQITKGGAKSWLFRFMMAGKAHGMGLGPTHTVSLAEARQKALAARKLLLDGINPLAAKKQDQLAAALANARMMTFDQCAEAYISAHRAGWKNEKHADQWTNTLNTYASPIFGQLPVAEVDTALVIKCLKPIWQAKTETATRLLSVSSASSRNTTSPVHEGQEKTSLQTVYSMRPFVSPACEVSYIHPSSSLISARILFPARAKLSKSKGKV